MSENDLQNQIFENFRLKETDELLQIWQENNRDEWSDLAFDVIERILQERGVEIPEQTDPALEQETEEDAQEIEEEPMLATGQPVFYNPQDVLWFIQASSITAWVTLGVYVVTGLWYLLANASRYEDTALFINGIMYFLVQIITGIISFALLKGVSFTLSLLMEFEFNTRSNKNIENNSETSA